MHIVLIRTLDGFIALEWCDGCIHFTILEVT
jgi:hypothetical protein